jgi:hypothetical protein
MTLRRADRLCAAQPVATDVTTRRRCRTSVRLAAVSRDMNCTSISSNKKISGKAKRTVSPRRTLDGAAVGAGRGCGLITGHRKAFTYA